MRFELQLGANRSDTQWYRAGIRNDAAARKARLYV